jgi:two-component system NarL family sensor kinase
MNRPLKLPDFVSLPERDSCAPSFGPHLIDSVNVLSLSSDSRLLEQTRATVEDLLKIHEYERQRMGQELHDSTGQLVIALLLNVARLRMVEEDCGEGGIIDEIEEIVGRIDREIRSLAFLHYPAELGDRSTASSIERLALGLGRRSGLQISFKGAGETPEVDDTVSMTLLRVTQEALVNVHRHSHATSATVEMKSDPAQIELRISDDGVGIPEPFEPANTGGIGLQGMRYRVEACGGQFEIRNLNPGLMVRAIVPLDGQG